MRMNFSVLSAEFQNSIMTGRSCALQFPAPWSQGGKMSKAILRRPGSESDNFEVVGGNGLMNRRALLGHGMFFAGAMGAGFGSSLTSAAAEPLADDPWSMVLGQTTPAYEVPSRFEKDVVRTLANPNVGPRVKRRAHAASYAQRHEYAERPSFRGSVRRRP
jgi:hypothetical protein